MGMGNASLSLDNIPGEEDSLADKGQSVPPLSPASTIPVLASPDATIGGEQGQWTLLTGVVAFMHYVWWDLPVCVCSSLHHELALILMQAQSRMAVHSLGVFLAPSPVWS